MFICELFAVGSESLEGDEDPLLESGIGHGAEELADDLDADVPGFPLLTLDGYGRVVFGDDEIDAAVGISSSAEFNCVAMFAVGEGNELLELEPIDGAELLNEAGGGIGLQRWSCCRLERMGEVGSFAGLLDFAAEEQAERDEQQDDEGDGYEYQKDKVDLGEGLAGFGGDEGQQDENANRLYTEAKEILLLLSATWHGVDVIGGGEVCNLQGDCHSIVKTR